MQADGDALMADDLAVANDVTGDFAQTALHDRPALRMGQIVGVTRPRMVCVGMRDDRPVHRPPGVDVEIAGRAVQPAISLLKQGCSQEFSPSRQCGLRPDVVEGARLVQGHRTGRREQGRWRQAGRVRDR